MESTTRPRVSGAASGASAPDAVSAYLRRIWAFEALPRETELELARRVRQARRDLVAALFRSPVVLDALDAALWALEGGKAVADELGFSTYPGPEGRAKVRALRCELARAAEPGPDRDRTLSAMLNETGLEHELVAWLAEHHRRALVEADRRARQGRRSGRGRLAVMSAVQVAVARAGRQASEAREELLRAHLRLVVSDARRFAGRGVPLGDLIQEGNLGLLAAANRFDPDLGYRFNTYAMWWIRAKLRACVAREGRTIRVPVRRLQALSRMHRAARALATELGREPTADELAERAELSVSDVQGLLDVPQEPLRFEALDARADGTSIYDRLGDAEAPDPLAEAADQDDRTLARSLFAALDDRELTIIRRRFGFAREEETLEQIGEKLGVTRERVRQLEARALRKMRAAAEARGRLGYDTHTDAA